MTGRDLCKSIGYEINAFALGQEPDVDEMNFVLSKVNRQLDLWNAQRQLTYNVNFTNLQLVANLQPHTIGKGVVITSASLTSNVATFIAANSFKVGDKVSIAGCITAAFNLSNQTVASASSTQFTIALTHANIGAESETVARAALVVNGSACPTFAVPVNRPVCIEAAAIIINTSPTPVTFPMNIRDDDWWAAQQVKGLISNLPTDLYYSPDWPNGSLFLWPIPSIAYGLELETQVLIANLSLDSTFSLPEGYEEALTLTVAEGMCGPFGLVIPANLPSRAMRARAAIQANNNLAGPLGTMAAGMPGGRGMSPNWLAGGFTGPSK
jgi:hypothetical protein